MTSMERMSISLKLADGPTALSRTDRGRSGRFIAGNDIVRFWSKVVVQPGGCWLWVGGLTKDGYGRFHVRLPTGRHGLVRAHRWAWEHLVGPIRPGWTLDHLPECTSKACVRPDHLEEVTRAENARRAAARRRGNNGGN